MKRYVITSGIIIISLSIFACSGNSDAPVVTGMTDAEKVAADAAALQITYSGSDSANSITGDIALPATGANGSTITWTSDTPGVIANDGTVTRPLPDSGGDITVVLTATVQNGKQAKSVTYTLTVKQYFMMYTVFVPNNTSNSVAEYTIAADGSLNLLSTITVSRPDSVGGSPNGKFIYIGSVMVGNLLQYSIDANGSLSPLATPQAWAGGNDMVIDPTGSYGYVINAYMGQLYQYNVGLDGNLTLMSPVSTISIGVGLTEIAIDPTGKYVYTSSGNGVDQFAISADGSLVAMTPASVAAGIYPSGVAVDPTGKYLYASSQNSHYVSQYTIGVNGSLTPMAVPTVATGTNPMSVAVDPSGKYLYVANWGSGDISQYTIGANGSLTPMGVATVAAGTKPLDLVVDPTGRYLYVVNTGSGDISQYTIGATGGLTPMATATVAAGTSPNSIAINGYLK